MTTIHCEGDYRRAEAEIARLSRIVEQLRHERDHWKREAYQLVEADLVDSIRDQFDMTANEAIVCAALYRRRDRRLGSALLEGLLDEERGFALESNVVSQIILAIRRKLGDAAIETVRRQGYKLSQETIERFDRQLPLDCRKLP